MDEYKLKKAFKEAYGNNVLFQDHVRILFDAKRIEFKKQPSDECIENAVEELIKTIKAGIGVNLTEMLLFMTHHILEKRRSSKNPSFILDAFQSVHERIILSINKIIDDELIHLKKEVRK